MASIKRKPDETHILVKMLAAIIVSIGISPIVADNLDHVFDSFVMIFVHGIWMLFLAPKLYNRLTFGLLWDMIIALTLFLSPDILYFGIYREIKYKYDKRTWYSQYLQLTDSHNFISFIRFLRLCVFFYCLYHSRNAVPAQAKHKSARKKKSRHEPPASIFQILKERINVLEKLVILTVIGTLAAAFFANKTDDLVDAILMVFLYIGWMMFVVPLLYQRLTFRLVSDFCVMLVLAFTPDICLNIYAITVSWPVQQPWIWFVSLVKWCRVCFVLHCLYCSLLGQKATGLNTKEVKGRNIKG